MTEVRRVEDVLACGREDVAAVMAEHAPRFVQLVEQMRPDVFALLAFVALMVDVEQAGGVERG